MGDDPGVPGWAVAAWVVVTLAAAAGMAVPAASLLAPPLIKPPAGLGGLWEVASWGLVPASSVFGRATLSDRGTS